MRHPIARSERGQTLTLFALMLVVLLLATGLVVDVGYALSQQRTAQNAADFAALAGTRILGELYTGEPAGAGTDDNVRDAVNSVLAANRSQLVSARYVDNTGLALGNVGSGIPSGAAGVVVNATTSWRPFFLGIMGVSQWSAGGNATASTQTFAAGGVMPIGIENTTFGSLPYCDPLDAACLTGAGSSATAKISGGFFGWLKFGAGDKKCHTSGDLPFGLGMDPTAGCDTNQGFLDGEIGPPPNSYGCCTDLSLTPNDDQRRIGSLTGNKVSKNLQWYIDHQVIVWVPIWDYGSDLNGASGYYHIVGYGAVVFTDVDKVHGEWLKAVRVSQNVGPTPNATLIGATGKVQLVH